MKTAEIWWFREDSMQSGTKIDCRSFLPSILSPTVKRSVDRSNWSFNHLSVRIANNCNAARFEGAVALFDFWIDSDGICCTFPPLNQTFLAQELGVHFWNILLSSKFSFQWHLDTVLYSEGRTTCKLPTPMPTPYSIQIRLRFGPERTALDFRWSRKF